MLVRLFDRLTFAFDILAISLMSCDTSAPFTNGPSRIARFDCSANSYPGGRLNCVTNVAASANCWYESKNSVYPIVGVGHKLITPFGNCGSYHSVSGILDVVFVPRLAIWFHIWWVTTVTS